MGAKTMQMLVMIIIPYVMNVVGKIYIDKLSKKFPLWLRESVEMHVYLLLIYIYTCTFICMYVCVLFICLFKWGSSNRSENSVGS
jgi:uncharacterized BrkB/YihY/UPF0761 family membrane protein